MGSVEVSVRALRYVVEKSGDAELFNVVCVQSGKWKVEKGKSRT